MTVPSMIQQWHAFDECALKTIKILHNYIQFEEKTHKSHKSQGSKLLFQFQNVLSGKIIDFCFVIEIPPPNPKFYVSEDNIMEMLINQANTLISILCDKTKTKIFVQGKTYSKNQNDCCSYPTWCKNDLNIVKILPGQILNDHDLSVLTRDVIKKNDVSSLKQIMLFKPDMLNKSIIPYSSFFFKTFHHPITALQYSAHLIQFDCIQLLLELKSDVNKKKNNLTPLEFALNHDHHLYYDDPFYNKQREKKYNSIKLLIDAKACLENSLIKFFEFKKRNHHDNDDHKILQLLLKSNASLDHIINQNYGETPLHLATELNDLGKIDTQCVRTLLQAKSNVNKINIFDNNALWERCEQIFNYQSSTGVDKIVKLLVDAKSELNYKSFSPLHYCKNWQSHTDLVEYLLDANCKI